MKRGLCIILVAALLCISIAGCSAPGAGQSSLSGLANVGAPSSGQVTPTSSTSPSSALEESSSQEISSASTNATASQQEEEPWVSPTGVRPYTSPKLYEYYEEHPEFKEYYYKYLVPYYPLQLSTWNTAQELAQCMLDEWIGKYIDRDDPNICSSEPLDRGYYLKQEKFEEVVEQYFDVDASLLRIEDDTLKYNKEREAYRFYFAAMIGEERAYVITDAKKEEDILTIVYLQCYDYTNTQEYLTKSELKIRLLPDNTFRYHSCRLLEERE